MSSHTIDGYRMIIVDDEPIVHRMMERIVRESHLPLNIVGTMSSGAEALEQVTELQPELCILDIQMDDINGLELAVRITELLERRPVIIYLTAHRSFDYAQQAVRLGAIDYLVKPIRAKDVVESLGRAVSSLQASRLEQMEKDRLRKQLESVLPAAVAEIGPAGEHRRAAIVKAARDFVDKHYSEPISLTDIAAYLNLSPGYLGSLFKAEYGITLRAYLRRIRIARAKELMRDPRLNLTEIAQRVGFVDISYFSQSFMEETGVRPSEYRGGGRRWPK